MPRTRITTTRYECEGPNCHNAAESPEGWFVAVPGADPGALMIYRAEPYEQLIGTGRIVERYLCGRDCLLAHVGEFAGSAVKRKTA